MSAPAPPGDAGDRGCVSGARTLGRRQCRHSLRLHVRLADRRAARPGAGADARQRGLRRHRARLAARRRAAPGARHALRRLRQHFGLPELRRRRPLRFALRRRGLQPAVDRGRARRPAADGRPRPGARAAAALRPRRLPHRPALDDRSLPAAGDGRAPAQGRGARAGAGAAPATSSSTAATRRANGCATTASSTMPTTRATRC